MKERPKIFDGPLWFRRFVCLCRGHTTKRDYEPYYQRMQPGHHAYEEGFKCRQCGDMIYPWKEAS